jgi:hypothetical protein
MEDTIGPPHGGLGVGDACEERNVTNVVLLIEEAKPPPDRNRQDVRSPLRERWLAIRYDEQTKVWKLQRRWTVSRLARGEDRKYEEQKDEPHPTRFGASRRHDNPHSPRSFTLQ